MDVTPSRRAVVRVFRAARLLPTPDDLVEGGGLLVEGDRVARVLRSASDVRRTAREAGVSVEDLGEELLAPGTVCAHAHLDLSALAGRTPRGADMTTWVRGVLEERARVDPGERRRAEAEAARALLASGTTLVGDVRGPAAGETEREACEPARVVLRELLDGRDPSRTEEALATVAEPLTPRPGLHEGLSPHAPHTVSAELLARASSLARARGAPLQVHWSETAEELEWLLDGTGPFAEWLPASPRRSGLDLLEEAGLLAPGTSLVHGNHPLPGEPERLAASDVTLVHCPGSHAFFERERFPLEVYLDAGVRLALGTDSLASNETLDLRRELRLLREAHPELAPARAWQLATLGGAAALGLSDHYGALTPGMRADFATWGATPSTAESAVDALTAGTPAVTGVWIGGLPALGGELPGPRGA